MKIKKNKGNKSKDDKSKSSVTISKSIKKKNATRNIVVTKNVLKSRKDKLKRKKYSNEAVESALKAVEKGFSYRKAAQVFGVPLTSVFRKVKNPDKLYARSGPSTFLSQDEENRIVNWILLRAEKGYPVTKPELLDNIQLYVAKKKNPFTDNRPGRHWYEGFRKRHPELAIRKAQNLIAERLVSEEDLRGWFNNISAY